MHSIRKVDQVVLFSIVPELLGSRVAEVPRNSLKGTDLLGFDAAFHVIFSLPSVFFCDIPA